MPKFKCDFLSDFQTMWNDKKDECSNQHLIGRPFSLNRKSINWALNIKEPLSYFASSSSCWKYILTWPSPIHSSIIWWSSQSTLTLRDTIPIFIGAMQSSKDLHLVKILSRLSNDPTSKKKSSCTKVKIKKLTSMLPAKLDTHNRIEALLGIQWLELRTAEPTC